MLQLYKNEVVTSATLQQADIRTAELKLYTDNFWVWGGTSTVLAGFLFEQITSPVPENTPWMLEFAYLFTTSLCLGLSLCIITWTVLICMWGPGKALRGPDGMKSFHDTLEYMKKEHRNMYHIFFVSILTYFASTTAKVWVFPSRARVNLVCTITLVVVFVLLLIMQCKLECRIGGSIWRHEGQDGRIRGLQKFEEVTDLDNFINAKVHPHHHMADLPGLTQVQAHEHGKREVDTK